MYSLLKRLFCSVHTGSERAVCLSVCQQHEAAKGPWPDNPSPPAEIYRAKIKPTKKTKEQVGFFLLVCFIFRRKKSGLFVMIHWFLIYLVVWSEGEGVAGSVGMVCDFQEFSSCQQISYKDQNQQWSDLTNTYCLGIESLMYLIPLCKLLLKVIKNTSLRHTPAL